MHGVNALTMRKKLSICPTTWGEVDNNSVYTTLTTKRPGVVNMITYSFDCTPNLENLGYPIAYPRPQYVPFEDSLLHPKNCMFSVIGPAHSESPSKAI